MILTTVLYETIVKFSLRRASIVSGPFPGETMESEGHRCTKIRMVAISGAGVSGCCVFSTRHRNSVLVNLACAAASLTTGITLPVDGGWLAYGYRTA